MIRPLDPPDGPNLARIGGQRDVARMMGSIRSPWTQPEVLDWIAQAPWRNAPGFRLAVCLPDGALIGTVGRPDP
jgi:[ribosomal protein S5]-alanine N-acetyltransferase